MDNNPNNLYVESIISFRKESGLKAANREFRLICKRHNLSFAEMLSLAAMTHHALYVN